MLKALLNHSCYHQRLSSTLYRHTQLVPSYLLPRVTANYATLVEKHGHPSSDSPPPPPATNTKARKQRRWRFNANWAALRPEKPRKRLRVRPGQIIRVRPRAIPIGTSKVYDEALKIIFSDAKTLRKEIKSLEPLLSEATAAGDDLRQQEIKDKLHILEIQSQINMPQIRWRFLSGIGNMKRAVFRHLAEKRWREDGGLDLIAERIYQMHVAPDLLPSIHPTLDLRVMFRESPPEDIVRRTRVKRRDKGVDPGSFLLSEQTRQPPTLYAETFHLEPRFYTLVMVDADYPDPENESYKTFLHWMVPNIELSALAHRVKVPKGNYSPPHPQAGTPYHRYVILLLQNPGGEKLDFPVSDHLASRDQFNVRSFVTQHGFNLGSNGHGGGVFMWREVWDETVSDIYRNTLKIPEPKYGKTPKFDMYGEVKEMRKYI